MYPWYDSDGDLTHWNVTMHPWNDRDLTRGTMCYREHRYDNACALLKTWLERSNGCPLSITLRLARNREAIPTRILDVVLQFSQQWERLEVTLANHQDLEIFRRRLAHPAPLLSSLSLNITATLRNPPQILDHLKSHSRLRDLKLFTSFRFSDIPRGRFPLTTLELDAGLSISQCTAIFGWFPSLLHLRLSIVDSLVHPVQTMEHVPSLESLTLDSGADLLALLTLPHLRHLRCTISAPELLTTLLSFLTRSACVLHHLALRIEPVMEDYALIECLKAVPSVQDLRIDYAFPGIRTLYRHLQAPAMLPRLQTLTVSENRDTYAYPDLVAMLCARRRRDPDVVKLSSFDLYLAAHTSEPSRDALIPSQICADKIVHLVEGGLRFCVHGPGVNWPRGGLRDELLEFPLCREA
ncbi:hypothetical protein C8R44DRAFT_984074 [Mycena epipterygia]|nr:hypothetical protein C8R44DRAFT_984074 [Mycena epipterygia]